MLGMENYRPGPVERPESLRDTVVRALRQAVLDGALAPGERINEIRLAAQLAVSPTPLREALLSLQHEEFLVATRNRGFSVAPLRGEEAEEIVQLLVQSEALVWRLFGGPPEAAAAAMERLAARLAQPRGSAEERLQLDQDWRAAAVAHAGNRRLLRRIAELRFAWSRYERAYARALGQAPIPLTGRDDMRAFWKDGDAAAASRAWEEHHRERLELLRFWLKRGRSAEPRKA